MPRSVLARFRDEVADGYVLGPVRATLGVLLAWDALCAAEELAKIGYFGDAFHIAMLPEALLPSHRAYALLLAARVCLAVMIMFGIWARPALAMAGVLGAYILLCDRNQFQDGRYSLYCFAFLLALSPCDRSWRATEPAVPEPRRGPFWAVRLAQLQVSIAYLASGGEKLLDPDWRDGLVLSNALATKLSPGCLDVLSRPDVASSLAKLSIMTELVVCVALWIRQTRIVAIWGGLWFHVALQAVTKVDTFSIVSVATLGLFVTPDYHPRAVRFDPSRLWGKIAGTVVPPLDWFGRFEVKPWEPDGRRGHSIVVSRRDGGVATGIRAFAMLTRCLPVLFPLWAPVALVASFTKRGDLTTGG
jgi:hypothetical protein